MRPRQARRLRAATRRETASLAACQQGIDDTRIGERRSVAEAADFALGDLAEDSAHDLARSSLRQGGREVDLFGRGEGADVVTDFGDQLLAQRVVAVLAGVQGDEGIDRGAL